MPKQSTVGKEKQRVARRMERFDCHGKLHVSLQNGVAVVSITHRQSHKPYICIGLPEKHRTAAQNLVGGTHSPYLKTELLADLLPSGGSLDWHRRSAP